MKRAGGSGGGGAAKRPATQSSREALGGAARAAKKPASAREALSVKAAMEIAFLHAVDHGLTALVEQLIPLVNVNVAEAESGCTALWIASKKGYLRIVELLLARGAQVDTAPAFTRCSPLIEAAYEGRTAICKALINASADVNFRNRQGGTALIFACEEERPAIVRMLIDYGADVNIRPDDGDSCLMAAADVGNLEIVQLLLNVEGSAGGGAAKKEVKSNAGDTAWSLAKARLARPLGDKSREDLKAIVELCKF